MNQSTQDPFMSWQELAQKTQEMWLDSAFVFSQRTQRMALAGVNPTDADHAEMSQMGLEKLEAAGESTMAAWQHFSQLQEVIWSAALQQTQAAIAMTGVDAGSATVSTLQGGALSVEQLQAATAQMAHAVLDPIHKRTSENAERLRQQDES